MSNKKANNEAPAQSTTSAVQARARDQLRAQFPVMAKRATGDSRAAAIKLFCFECHGGVLSEARQCEETDCFLWPYSPAAARETRKNGLPRRQDRLEPISNPQTGGPPSAGSGLARRPSGALEEACHD